MSELIKYRRKLLIVLGIVFFLGVGGMILIVGATPSFSKQFYAILLFLVLFLIIGLMIEQTIQGIKLSNALLEKQKAADAQKVDEVEEMEKEVEEKMKEVDELEGMNLTKLQKEIKGINNWEEFGNALLRILAGQLEIVLGIAYQYSSIEQNYLPVATYAYYSDNEPEAFKIGEGLNGQVAKDQKPLVVTQIPEGYTNVVSGLGDTQPNELAIIPLIKQDEVVGLIEIATFKPLGKNFENKLQRLVYDIGEHTPAIDKLD